MCAAKTYFEINPFSKPGSLRKDGCLPRTSAFGEWFPAAADYIKTIPRGEWKGIIAQRKAEGVSLRDVVPAILDQDGKGSCAAEMATGALMDVRAFSGLDHVLLNPWSLYHFSGNGRDGGSNIDTNLRYLRDQGVLPMGVWGRSHGIRRPPNDLMEEHGMKYRVDEWYDIRSKEEFASALLTGYTVCYGRRGHAIRAIDLLDEDRFLYANSWGNWGDEGFGIDRLSRDVAWNYGAWATRTVRDS